MNTIELCDKRIAVSLNKGIGEIVFNDPDSWNAFDGESCEAFAQAATWLSLQSDVRVVLLKGRGKAFSVGGSIVAFSKAGDASDELLATMTTYFHTAVSRLTRMDATVIGVIDGVCGGAGASLVCVPDVVIASEATNITFAYTASAISPDGGATYFLPRIVGTRKAYELLTMNPTLSAREAEKLGLINRVVAVDELEKEAAALAQRYAQGPTKAYGAVKKLLLKGFDQGLEAQLNDEGHSIAALSVSSDGKEGIQAFIDKRKPKYVGR